MIQLSRMCAVFGAAEFLLTPADVLDTIPIQYILLPNGKVKHRRLLPGDRWLEILVGLEDIPWRKVEMDASFMKPTGNILPGGRKLPRILLDQIISFFRHYMEPVVKTTTRNASGKTTANHWGYGDDFEAAAHIIYNANSKELRVGVPTQVVSGGRVTFKHDHYDINNGDIIIVDFHSHNSMGAFFSTVDDASDEKAVFYSGVIGRLDRTEPEIVLRLNVGKKIKEELEVEDIFESATSVDFPEEWKGKVQKDQRASLYDFDWTSGNGLGTWWADREAFFDDVDSKTPPARGASNPGLQGKGNFISTKPFNDKGSLKKMLDRFNYGGQFTGQLLGNWAEVNQQLGYQENYWLSDDNDLRALIRSSLLCVRQYLDEMRAPADKEKFFEAKADFELFCLESKKRVNRWLWTLCRALANFDPDHEDKFTNRRLLGQLLFLMEVPAATPPAGTSSTTTTATNPPAATPASLALVGKASGPDSPATNH